MSKPVAATAIPVAGGPVAPPPLVHGERLTRAEFERRYDAMPHTNKAELIEGVVHMPSPVGLQKHGEPHLGLITWLGFYRAHTRGVRGANNTTTRVDTDNEMQPDGALFIDPACGGRVKISVDDYLEGSPDLIAEVSGSSARTDKTVKFRVYQRNLVQEYVVWRVLDKEVDWFALEKSEFKSLPKDDAGIIRSRVFPGLWLDVRALLDNDLAKLLEVLRQGLASPEHAEFVERLQAHRKA